MPDMLVSLALGAPVVATVVSSPDSSDKYAVLGAMLAAFLGFLKMRERGSAWLDVAYVVTVRSAIGSFCPGFVVFIAPYVLFEAWTEALDSLTWHAYALMGFVLGICADDVLKMLTGIIPSWLGKLTPATQEKKKRP